MMLALLACLGITYILKYSTLLNAVRGALIARAILFEELFKCSLCLGFWAGVMVSPWVAHHADVHQAWLLPWASAAWCWSCDTLHDLVVAVINHLKR